MSKSISKKRKPTTGKVTPCATPKEKTPGATSGEDLLTEQKSSLEDELTWCIAQLEIGCERKGASKDQKEHNKLVIKKLQSSKTPLPKKRQIMRSVFGDYRSKMNADPLQTPAVPKFTSSTKDKPLQSGSFYRVASSTAHHSR